MLQTVGENEARDHASDRFPKLIDERHIDYALRVIEPHEPDESIGISAVRKSNRGGIAGYFLEAGTVAAAIHEREKRKCG